MGCLQNGTRVDKEVMSSARRSHLAAYRNGVLKILKDLRSKKVSAQHAADALMNVYSELLIWLQDYNYGPKHPYYVFAGRVRQIAILLENDSDK